ncbi:phosphopantetheine-binding protein [Roseburia hominis]|uniref:Carrier domain-containing protein n=1 Tax=Roseburia hominis TaxID=301301 RepID=A0A395V7X6_9FIRM|nr:phosphopantetheine-binding protein [Roseburia hominis]RGS37156.1 hypothetical protein DWX93_14810 [Roseburia hominis]
MEQEILHILQEINPYMEIETGTKLLEEEILDSMEILLLISELEDKYQIQIPLESLQLEDFQDILSITKFVKKQIEGTQYDN